jgi:mono/diheme cytochrome c family protein
MKNDSIGIRQFVMTSLFQQQGGMICLLLMLSVPIGIITDRAVAAEADLRTDAKATDIDFNRDVRPILAAKCFACHGPDDKAREAKLRLDTFAGATADLDGYSALVPGKPDDSELILRILTDDRKELMPPVKSKLSLSHEQKQILVQWVKQGGAFDQHWAFVPPKQPALPQLSASSKSKFPGWSTNGIDHFVLARLEKEGLTPSPRADRYVLARRLYLDLIGLPPTPQQADEFVTSKDPKAYEKLIDQLLASKHYGERWARQWLDLARYADTNGYEKDRNRTIWPYRDWVIQALNSDMPFDQFSIEQLAGDMLPNATPSQRIATGFHRNTMLNEEGGIDPLEYRFYAMTDRVATTGVVWMGMTTGCAQCHSHKYDPISHTDYYRLMSLMNNADEPDFLIPKTELIAKRALLGKQIADLEAKLPAQFPAAKGQSATVANRKAYLQKQFEQWISGQKAKSVNWTVITPAKMKTNLPRLEILDDGSLFSTGDITKRDVFELSFQLAALKASAKDVKQNVKPLSITAIRLEVLPDDRLPARGPGRAYYEGRKGDFFLSDLVAKIDGKTVAFGSASHSYGKISIGNGGAKATNVIDSKGSTGWSTSGSEGKASQLVLNLKNPVEVMPDGKLDIELIFERHFAASLGRFRFAITSDTKKVSATSMPVAVESALAKAKVGASKEDRELLMQHFLRTTPHLATARKRIDALRKQLPKLPITMVMNERPVDNPRMTHRHHRGEYLSPREKVLPGIPQVFASLTKDQPKDRLALARWLVSKGNPLVGRVTVNRAWRSFFGIGLVETSGDFGTQSNPPSHRELIDWLATEFVARGWSMKKLHRLIVTSATYQQSSVVSGNLLKRDPANRLLARGPRFRVDAEVIRDVVLQASGLMSPKMFGASVHPPQPKSVTAHAFGNTHWPVSKGEARYRRSLYTYSKRTAPFAAITVFDGPTGESCTPRRNRSNSPLAALTLLNDEMYMEMVRALAEKAMAFEAQAGSSKVEGNIKTRAVWVFRQLATRPPSDDERDTLVAYYQQQLKRIKAGELKTSDLIGATKTKLNRDELAAWVLVSRVVMNLDEVITKQ